MPAAEAEPAEPRAGPDAAEAGANTETALAEIPGPHSSDAEEWTDARGRTAEQRRSERQRALERVDKAKSQIVSEAYDRGYKCGIAQAQTLQHQLDARAIETAKAEGWMRLAPAPALTGAGAGASSRCIATAEHSRTS